MTTTANKESELARYLAWPNLVSMFFERAAQEGDRPFLWAKPHGAGWASLAWPEVARRVRAVAHGLIALGIRPGDRVVLVSENRPEWLIADLGVMAAGAVTVPAYVTNTPDDHLHILSDSGAVAAIVSTAQLGRRLMPAALRAPQLNTVIAIEPLRAEQASGDVHILTWETLLERGAAGTEPLPGEAATRQDLACLIYTSGTGGRPKGVMLSHGAILCNCMSACDLLTDLGLAHEVFLSFLPLSHSYEHSAGQFFPISIGAEIYYAESIEALTRNMTEVRPTIMTAVPRLYETMHRRVLNGMERAPRLNRWLFEKALALGRKRYEDPESLGLGGRLLDRLLDRLVRRKVAARFGGRLKAFVSGGAPLNTEIGLFFNALGVRLLQGYGLTETAPVVSCNRPSNNRFDTVGPPLRGVTVKIAEDGEILVAGELCMLGYWNQAEATAQVLKDGWVHTGDIGTIDDAGRIRITDRKKDIIVNSGGDNIAPQRVEGFLTLQPEIAQAMVYGDRRPYLVALLVPDADWAKGWAAANGKPADLHLLADDPEFRKALGAVTDRVNKGLAVIEHVRRLVVAPEPFTTENGMLTPSLKIRRHIIRQTWQPALDALYGAG